MLKKIAQSLGLASLILLQNYADMLFGRSNVRMHWPSPVAKVCFAQILDILIVAAVLFAILALTRKTRYASWVRLLLAIAIPPYLVERFREISPFAIPDGFAMLVLAVWAAALLLLVLRFPLLYRRTMRLGSAVIAFSVFFAISSISQLLILATWRPGPHVRNAVWETASQPPRNHAKIVWIVFDELSYDQVFEHRARDLRLPNFDALRNESTVFSNVQPIGDETVKVLPSLLTGRVVNDYDFTWGNHLRVKYDDARHWQTINGKNSVFADAQQQGWRTAVVGWYNPYCTVFGDAIGQCYWFNADKFDAPMAQRFSIAHNTAVPLKMLVQQLVQPDAADHAMCDYDVQQRHHTHVNLQEHAMKLLETDQADMVFLHFAIPHSPNIWSRMTNSYVDTCDSSYIDNLALVDRVLGEVMQRLQQSPRWKDTTLIVEGDHSWRTYLWDWRTAWTNEDDEASHADFDPRPALVIHHAGQTQPEVISAPVSLIGVHQAVEDTLRSQAAVR